MISINTKKYEPLIRQVLIDDREVARKDFAMEQYAPFNPCIEHLEEGDYIFKGYNGVDVCFEYKTGNDFLNSIDQHLHNQTYHMIQEYEYTFIIVECMDLQKEMDKLHFSAGIDLSFPQINGAISEFNTVTTVILTQTKYQAFDMMMRQAGKIIMDKPFKYKFGKKTANPALNYLSSINGMDEIAENICNTLNIRTLDKLLKVTKEELMTVNLVGEKRAEKILFELKPHEKQTVFKN